MPRRRNPMPRGVGDIEEEPEVVTHAEFRTTISLLAQFMNNRPQQVERNPGALVRDFMRMNPPEFYGSKVEEDAMEFIDETEKVLVVMGATSEEKAELAAYQLKGVSYIWYTQWKEARNGNLGSIAWGEFKDAFLDRFFPLELREAKIQEFINLKQGSGSVKEYSLKFTQLSKYAPSMIAEPRAKMSKFMSGLSEDLETECRTAMLMKDMDISRLMTFLEQIEEGRIKKEVRNFKKARLDEGGSSFAKDRNNKGKRVVNPYPTCEKCGRMHLGECKIGQQGCFECGDLGHKRRDCPVMARRGKRKS